MGVYLFNTPVLDKVLWEDHLRRESTHDFGKDIIPRMVNGSYNVYGFPYSGYWVDVGTTQSYWQAHMDLLSSPPSIDLNNRSWVIHTRTEERPPVFVADGAGIRNSMISDGCVLEEGALVVNSVLSPGVVVHSGARVENSILLTDTVVGTGSQVLNTITDKRVVIGNGCQIGVGFPEGNPIITTIGKNATLPDNLIVEPGAVIDTEVTPPDFKSLVLKRGEFIQAKGMPYEI